jgi:DNA-directed RNA polymerase subunit RPC12/RpoP
MAWKCDKCGKEFENKLDASKHERICKKIDNSKQIQEYKRKCKQCGKVWHSLVLREKQMEKQNQCDACVQCSTAFNGDLTTATQSQRNREAKEQTLANLRRCPSCGSQNYKEEIISYEKK